MSTLGQRFLLAAVLVLFVPPHLAFSQGVADRVKAEMERANALGQEGKHEERLQVYDALLADPEVAKSPLAGMIKVAAIGLADWIKGSEEAIRRANEYLRGDLEDQYRGSILLLLAKAYLKKDMRKEANGALDRIWPLKGATPEVRFEAHYFSGDSRAALGFFRRNVEKFSVPPPNLPTVILTVERTASKGELAPGQEIAMGDAPADVGPDLAFATRWYFEKNDKGATTAYAEPLHLMIERIYTRAGRPVEAAQFIEAVVKDAPAAHEVSERMKYLAAQLYVTAKQMKEARRCLLELERKWPSSREKAELLLASIDLLEDVEAAVDRLEELYAKSKTSEVWFASGEQLCVLYEKQSQWEKALALQKEMGKRDHRRLMKWALLKEQQAKRSEDALALFSQHRQQRPNEHGAYEGQIRCLRTLRRSEEALKVCDEVCEHFGLGKEAQWPLFQSTQLCFWDLKRYEETAERSLIFLSRYPESDSRKSVVGAFVESVRMLTLDGRYKEAEALCEKYLSSFKRDKEALEVWMQQAEAYINQKKGNEAIEVLEKAIIEQKLAPDNLPERVRQLLEMARQVIAEQEAGIGHDEEP